MIYVLIIMTWMSRGGGYVVATQEFSSRDSCQVAANFIKQNWDSAESSLKVLCVPK